MKVIIGFSGGIDSTMAACFLREEGHSVIPVTLVFHAKNREETLWRAHKAAVTAGMDAPIVEDVSDLFQKNVIQSFLSSYERGCTPNPCIYCNEKVKLKSLFEVAARHGCKAVATGHYARTSNGRRFGIFKGIDPRKDQSYMLYRLPRDWYERIHFPLGCRTKQEIKQKAWTLFPSLKDITVESNDLCFLAKGRLPDFLEENVSNSPGEIVTIDGKTIGTHRGLSQYTIGQRQGLGLSKGPWFVVDKYITSNRLVVGRRNNLAVNVIECSDIVLHEDLFSGQIVSMRHRYRTNFVNSEILSISKEKLRIFCHEPACGVAPGQSAVLYSGDRIIGGGIIEKTYWRRPSHEAITSPSES